MNKVKDTIEWADYTWNPIKGICPVGCAYCYARKIYKRFKMISSIRFDNDELNAINKIKHPARIFVGSTIDIFYRNDIFYNSIPHNWVARIIEKAESLSKHLFLSLTKNPYELLCWKFPQNWWVGITLTKEEDLISAGYVLHYGKERGLFLGRCFVCFEPLLDDFVRESFFKERLFDWVIVGGLTPRPVHKEEWIDKIVEYSHKYNIPVFIKENARYREKIKEIPE